MIYNLLFFMQMRFSSRLECFRLKGRMNIQKLLYTATCQLQIFTGERLNCLQNHLPQFGGCLASIHINRFCLEFVRRKASLRLTQRQLHADFTLLCVSFRLNFERAKFRGMNDVP